MSTGMNEPEEAANDDSHPEAAPAPGNTATAAAFQNNGTDRVGGQPAANFDPEERHPTITPGPAEEEDRQEVDDRGLTTDTGSSD